MSSKQACCPFEEMTDVEAQRKAQARMNKPRLAFVIRHSDFVILMILSPIYDPAGFGRKNRRRFWRGEQAQHRLGDRESLVRGRRALDF
jgi:hypothetical protein